MIKRTLRSYNYLKSIAICHGKSEVLMVRYIQSNLHINAKIFSKDSGEHSIQITSLMRHLNSYPFDTIQNFLKEYGKESFDISGKGASRTINNFKLFIIMDTDDCTEKQKESFITKEMFKAHWLYEYLVPIYSITNLEDVLVKAKIIPKIKDSEKGRYYTKVFPLKKGEPITDGTIEEIKEFRDKVETQNRNTNIHEMVDYFLSLVSKI